MHKIGKTGKVTLEDKTFEVELKPHHHERTYEECEKDCPKGWQIPAYWLLQQMRNNPTIREEFSLSNIWEYVQNPDNSSKENSYVAWFVANSVWAYLGCNEEPSLRNSNLGVRYAREISE